ncbi:MAG: hypothetical protein KF914_16130 [Rhizobiaceae bacterium]|uniref:hypothetical protein n=1 Tax=Phenylobacterium sp. TaxID=1871053 RepID=UPI0025DD75DB|nr:hypothetical protein [Phenylobacterium sp.]MBX3485227.1 hypothetical protein [Phenylobacterium sp.]MBX3569591.1 hypothetical protein [Rhizobiaceae bacterium]
MTAILYPVAANGEQALSRPLGRAARKSEAARRAGAGVAFTTDAIGPAFATREAALDAYSGRVEDERTGAAPEAEDRYCSLVEQVAEGAPRPKPVEPSYAGGHRWPDPPKTPPKTVWRLTVSYWRVGTAGRPLDPPQARDARKSKQPLEADALRAISRAPLRPTKPQQPLDIGLFETRPPEAPHIVMPDE